MKSENPNICSSSCCVCSKSRFHAIQSRARRARSRTSWKVFTRVLPHLIYLTRSKNLYKRKKEIIHLRTFIGVETAALTFRTKQYNTSHSSHICYGKRFYNDFFLNHHTIALVNNCLKLLSCVVIEIALDLMKKNQLS